MWASQMHNFFPDFHMTGEKSNWLWIGKINPPKYCISELNTGAVRRLLYLSCKGYVP